MAKLLSWPGFSDHNAAHTNDQSVLSHDTDSLVKRHRSGSTPAVAGAACTAAFQRPFSLPRAVTSELQRYPPPNPIVPRPCKKKTRDMATKRSQFSTDGSLKSNRSAWVPVCTKRRAPAAARTHHRRRQFRDLSFHSACTCTCIDCGARPMGLFGSGLKVFRDHIHVHWPQSERRE